MVVNDLLIPGTSQWDVSLLEELFCGRDVEEITNSPLNPSGVDDIRVWHYDKKGKYMVKSSYRIARNFSEDDNRENSALWSKIWKLKLPPKIKHFVWRACTNCLPLRSNLSRRNIVVEPVCAFCRVEMETCWHVFVSCRYCRDCWREAGLNDFVEERAAAAESFTEFMDTGITDADHWLAAKLCAVMWSIWRQRNCEIWENSHTSAVVTVRVAAVVLSDWSISLGLGNAEFYNNTEEHSQRWKKPNFPYMKCNVDAAICQQRKLTGIGVVLRNDQGEFIVARTIYFPGIYAIREAEAISVREALSWLHDLGIRQVVVETDAKYVVDSLTSHEFGISEYDFVIQECRAFLQSEPEVSAKFVRRNANMVAHELAKGSFSFDSPSVWNFPPLCIVNLLSLDALD
ncbi:hypothetical protein DH2020_008341 [Rehmannia glutinosa]|uniref:Uncharacterized protein n=1 Tax=Rehmannia glutinosa TaxID=99300 RepID=A0ABR0U126_REHGL